MPIPYNLAAEIARRLSKGADVADLKDALAPTSHEERPVSPSVPARGETTDEAVRKRVEFLEEFAGPLPHLSGEAPQPGAEELAGNIENLIGMTSIPTGVAGPLRINGLHAHGDFYVPMATSEGALVASYSRGAKIVTLAGGASCLTTVEQVQRAPGFVFDTMAEAIQFTAWLVGEFERIREVAESTTQHGRLVNMRVQPQANFVYLILDFYPGDAAGQNMVTFAAQAACEDLVQRTPIVPRQWVIDSNMSGDKKGTSLSFFDTRGRHTTAEVTLPRALVKERLRTTPERIGDAWRMGVIGGIQTGSIGVSGHVANAVAAVFLACGQDVACVSEASTALHRMEATEKGDLYACVTMPNLILGTVGGGTRLPTATESLRILGCLGDNGAAKLSEITAGLALAGEISIMAAMATGEFAQAHQALGRPKQNSE
ncbi:MAG: 3-hydroxy-3-methylglutaryl-CoA reductase [Gemmatimonadetes bacterium]|jgi:hydroxymethylglutaryl-CoA reductase (NADPH)|nr:3-hydroxy-3-methylglutaryl-CoA reductase [Gemmatimonadota bacterium]